MKKLQRGNNMSGKEINDKFIFPSCRLLYEWAQSGKNFIALIVCAVTLYHWASGQFTEVKTAIASIKANAHYIDSDKLEHNQFQTCLYRQAEINEGVSDTLQTLWQGQQILNALIEK